MYRHPTARKPLFDKILIANRGEIACRVIKTARRLGIKTVAIYSKADRYAQHVQMADDAYCVGPAPSAQSYLNVDKILEIIRRTGAQAVHPGYGFLSENAQFAERLKGEGITFIGPPASAIVSMGSKSESKNIMEQARVPVVPGYHGTNQDPDYLQEQAALIGYPVLIKAIKGGGGKGMRIVERPEDFTVMLESSRRESLKSFGDDQVLIEKYLVRPRHVEVQVFADQLGNAVHLYERDCSVQRRHQKVLEEAPAPNLPADVRASLGQKAVAAALAVRYEGAGTVEFILDCDTQQFYFMEMNTRLQVEHPVTEWVTNTDLVQWQLEVAAGNPLPLTQAEIPLVGHAFEARIYAENPRRGFLPDTGPLAYVATPAASDSVRVDTGVVQGDQVSVHYDPMIAKLIVRGPDRATALLALRRALADYRVVGLHTNLDFLHNVASHPAFEAGEVETGFIAKHEATLLAPPLAPSPALIVQAALALQLTRRTPQNSSSGDPNSPWKAWSALRLNTTHRETCVLHYAGEADDAPQVFQVELEDLPNGCCHATIVQGDAGAVHRLENVTCRLDHTAVTHPNYAEGAAGTTTLPLGTTYDFTTDLGGRVVRATAVLTETAHLTVFSEDGRADFTLPPPAYLSGGAAEAAGSVKTPMPCKISQVMVEVGQVVEKNAPLIILEAMKMEHVVRAPFAGTVKQLFYAVGDLVQENKSLLELDSDDLPL
ncbi:hypothetical protein IWQ60_009053 [Tieghemiomyces parasiticus]|uniref:Uncharacterized protein n=1 Tax=Tieghemiomyces parasiticus TaxID=78921 RepID=A0A9W8DQA9_9FUNG|nr:hypothetical protein IWQ60_009053 [Tieghemiomyces parasiticus]